MRPDGDNYVSLPVRASIPESAHHKQLINYLRAEGIPHSGSMNGEFSRARDRCRALQMGLSVGHPDVAVYAARGGYHGLFVELKRDAGSVVSTAQALYHHELRLGGYKVVVAVGVVEAVGAVEAYMAKPRTLSAVALKLDDGEWLKS